jgi:hypothetical protein
VLLRRRKATKAVPLVLALALGAGGIVTVTEVGAGEAPAAAQARAKAANVEVSAQTVATITRGGGRVRVAFADGSSHDVPEAAFRLGEERSRAGRVRAMANGGLDVVRANDPVVRRVVRGRNGAVRRLTLVMVDDAAAAAAIVAARNAGN